MSLGNLSAIKAGQLTSKSPSIDPECSWRDMTVEQIQSAKCWQIFWGILSSLSIAGTITCFAFATIWTNRDSIFFYPSAAATFDLGVVALYQTVRDREFDYNSYSYPTKVDIYGDPYSYYYQNHSKYSGNTPESRSNMVRVFKTKNWSTINYILNRDNYEELRLNLGPLVRNKMITIKWAEQLKALGEKYKQECSLSENQRLEQPAWTRVTSMSAMYREKERYEAWVAVHGKPKCPRELLDKKFEAKWRILQTSLIFDSSDAINILPEPLMHLVRDYY